MPKPFAPKPSRPCMSVIDDIMAGRPPREPRDWEDGNSGTPTAPTLDKTERPETPIGGPAADQ